MPDLELTILGSASGLPEADRSHAAIALQQGDDLWLLDAGEGVCSSMLRCGIDPEKLRGIYLTHLHPDHCIGLFMVLQYLHVRYWEQQVDIYLPGGAIDLFQKFLDQVYLVRGEIHPHYTLNPIEDRQALSDHLTLETHPTNHLARWAALEIPGLETRAYSFRIVNTGKSIFYSGDIDSVSDLEPYLKPREHLILEAAHIDYAAVLELARQLQLQKIVLTHALPEKRIELIDFQVKAQKIGIKVDIARDGFKLIV